MKNVLIGFLKTYPGAEKIEAKNNNTSIFSQFKNKSSQLLGYNCDEDSEACYLQIRNLIEQACSTNNPKLWVKLILTTAKAGYRTRTNSVQDSQLACAAFALHMYLHTQVSNKVHSIKDNNNPDQEEQLAFKIHSTIQQLITRHKRRIEKIIEIINEDDELELSEIFANKLKIDTEVVKSFEEKACDMLALSQRILFFLGDNSLKKAKYIKEATELFEKLPYYSDGIRKKYKLTAEQISKMKMHLPMFLQEIYPSLHIKDKHNDSKPIETVIQSFEKNVQINEKLENKPIQPSVPTPHTPPSSSINTDEILSQTMLSQAPTDSSVDYTTTFSPPLTPNGISLYHSDSHENSAYSIMKQLQQRASPETSAIHSSPTPESPAPTSDISAADSVQDIPLIRVLPEYKQTAPDNQDLSYYSDTSMSTASTQNIPSKNKKSFNKRQ